MKKALTAITITAAAAFALAGCATTTTPATVETVTTESAAQSAAASIDSRFNDAAVWEQTKVTAQTLCQLADEAPDTAFETSILVAGDQGIQPEQVGVIWGIAVTMYCPEHSDIAK